MYSLTLTWVHSDPLSLFLSSCGILNLIFEALAQSCLYSRFLLIHPTVALKYVTDRDDFKAMSSSPVNSRAHHLSSYCCLRETEAQPHSRIPPCLLFVYSTVLWIIKIQKSNLFNMLTIIRDIPMQSQSRSISKENNLIEIQSLSARTSIKRTPG